MANRTVKDAISIKGINPQYLVEKIIRTRIYDSRYWKEECFALTAELLVDKAMELKSIGGVYGGNVRPSAFICLILKMLQIQPEKDIIIEFIRNEDFKYVRALGAMYMRLTGNSVDVHKYLEPLYVDYRKMKRLNKAGKYELIHMDELIDELLNSERVCDIALPRLQKRQVLEETNELEPRISPLDVNLDDVESSSEDDSVENEKIEKPESNPKHSRKESEERTKDSSRKYREKQSFAYVDYDNPKPEGIIIYI
jgi:pre-mRNA-splicing factor 38A